MEKLIGKIKRSLTPRSIMKKKERILEASEQIDLLRSKLDISADLVHDYLVSRKSEKYNSVYLKDEPLVTVCIATYNRADLLVKRSVASLLSQTYKNIEIVVVGDCCTDHTEELISKISDSRLRFYNLERRGEYPEDRLSRWMVAGTVPMNFALEKANGDFVTHLDDDDEYLPNRIEKLIEIAKSKKADLVYHPFLMEKKPGVWKTVDADAFRQTQVTTSSIFYHSWFSKVKWDILSYKYKEPGDWNRLRKFKFLEAKVAKCSHPLTRHYLQMNQRKN